METLPTWMLTSNMREEMKRRARRTFIWYRVRAAFVPLLIALVLISCALAASYGDTISGVNPAPSSISN